MVMKNVIDRLTTPEKVVSFALLISVTLIAAAHIMERFGGLEACILCLDQREAHWAAIGISVAALFSARILKARIGAAAGVGALALVYTFSAGLAFYHVGVEFEYWPGPAICAGGGGNTEVDLAAVQDALSGTKTDVVSCDDVQWSFLGISLAGYNLLISAGLIALTGLAAAAEFSRIRKMRTIITSPQEVTK